MLAGLIFAYWTVTFIDVNVTTGAHYGFTIGDNKRAVFQMGADTFGPGNGRMAAQAPGVLGTRMDFTEADFQNLAKHDVWVFHYDDTLPVDRIVLTFDGDRLISIHRQRACCPWLPSDFF